MSINDDSRAHRAQPIDFALKVIHQVFGHYMTPDDSMGVWELQLKNGMWYADDILFAFRHVLAQGAAGLTERARDITSNTFSLSTHRPGTPGGDEELHAWLAEMTDLFQARFDARLGREEVSDEELVFADDQAAALAEVLAEVPFWAAEVEGRAEDASAEYGQGAWQVRVSYILPYR